MNREEAKKRGQLLKRLREEHQDTVKRTQDRLKYQKEIQRRICQSTREAPKTVPEIAELTDLPAHEVLWHIAAMKKYDLISETGICGEYYLYQRVEAKKR
jgi:predicted transcriptional regulator